MTGTIASTSAASRHLPPCTRENRCQIPIKCSIRAVTASLIAGGCGRLSCRRLRLPIQAGRASAGGTSGKSGRQIARKTAIWVCSAQTCRSRRRGAVVWISTCGKSCWGRGGNFECKSEIHGLARHALRRERDNMRHKRNRSHRIGLSPMYPPIHEGGALQLGTIDGHSRSQV